MHFSQKIEKNDFIFASNKSIYLHFLHKNHNMKVFLISAFLFCILTEGFAQSSESKEKKIYEYLEVTGASKMSVQITQQMILSFKDSYSNVEEKFWDEFLKEIDVDGMTKIIVPIYDKYFTEEDIDQLIIFYKTPLGQKMLELHPKISLDAMEAGKIWGQEIAEKILFDLKENNYL